MFHKIEACRVCQGSFLKPVVNLGQQCLQGQFPLPDQPDPPKGPVEVVRCPTCGLVQSLYYCDPKAHFETYGYRSGVSQTMRDHLTALAVEAGEMVAGITAPRVLSIGGNDGFELNAIPFGTGNRTLIDPSDIPVEHPGISHIRGFFPDALMLTQQFDLVMSIACFYSVPSPVAFAQAVKKVLSPKGIWVCEVADLYSVLMNVAYDYFCFEHVTLLSPCSMNEIANRAGLQIVRAEPNKSNGGSVRYYLTHLENNIGRQDWDGKWGALLAHAKGMRDTDSYYERFALSVARTKAMLVEKVLVRKTAGGDIHTLGASTKLNVLLQYCGLDHRLITKSSDRDPRKVGKVCPGSRIPVVSEQESREDRPAMYLTILPFKDEILKREAEANSHTPILFALPWPEVLVPK